MAGAAVGNLSGDNNVAPHGGGIRVLTDVHRRGWVEFGEQNKLRGCEKQKRTSDTHRQVTQEMQLPADAGHEGAERGSIPSAERVRSSETPRHGSALAVAERTGRARLQMLTIVQSDVCVCTRRTLFWDGERHRHDRACWCTVAQPQQHVHESEAVWSAISSGAQRCGVSSMRKVALNARGMCCVYVSSSMLVNVGLGLCLRCVVSQIAERMEGRCAPR